ncbi:MAG: hypothetical protein ACK5JT_02355 [Hyphomicrobiaceae bacterium]
MRPRFKVDDEVGWGMLIKSFATGRNYLTPDGPPIPLPRTLQELKDICVAQGLDVTFPDYHTGLVIIQLSEEVFSIRLPPKTMIDEMEKYLDEGGNYAAPKFYEEFYLANLDQSSVEKKRRFHAARIGDYSVRMCA